MQGLGVDTEVGTDVAFATIAGKITGMVHSNRVAGAVSDIHRSRAAAIHVDPVPGAELQQPIGGFSVQRAVTVTGLPSVDSHEQEIPAILGHSESGARLHLMDRAVRIRADGCGANIDAV